MTSDDVMRGAEWVRRQPGESAQGILDQVPAASLVEAAVAQTIAKIEG